MADYKVYHVAPSPDGGWNVEGEQSERASDRFDTKDQAIERGRELAKARNGQLKIHKQDGTIETEYTYGHDPTSRPG
jgi:hypothetical protein